MADMYLPGAIRHDIGNTAPLNGGAPRVVWHTTSNDTDWSFKNESGYFADGGRKYAPHLVWDPFTGQIAQYFPANSRSLSLEDGGGVAINRVGKYCIQIEIVFTEGETVGGKKYNSVRETPCKGLGTIMAWLRSLGIPDTWPGGAPTAFRRDDVSLSTWLRDGGHYGHNQVPYNHHVDPGPMPELFKAVKPTPAPAPAPAPKLVAHPYHGRVLRRVSPLMHGADVHEWQEGMKGRGWRISVDGYYGDESRELCRQFQAGHGLSADGEVGPKTWAATFQK